MNGVFILSILFFGGVLPTYATDGVATLEPFNWEKGGSYLATGTFVGKSLFPVISNASTSPSSFAIDPTTQRYAWQINQDNIQYGLPNGTYVTGVNDTCYLIPLTYSDFVRVYASAVEVSAGILTSLGILSTYSGLVRDPGTCNMYAGVTLTQGIGGRIVNFGFGQVLNLGPTVGLPYPAFIPGHVAGAIRYDTWKNGVPAASYFQLPPQCYQATPRDYCEWYYPNGPFTTPV